MAFITKAQVKKAIASGSINPRMIDDFFHDIKYKAYDYDYLVQNQLIDLYIQHNDFKNDVFKHTDVIMDGVREGYRDKVSILQLDKSIVQYSKRKSFKHYSFYNKPLTQEAMMQRRDIFKYGVLVFINGTLYLNYRIQPRDDKTFILFPYTAFDTIVKDGDKITTVMIPESLVATSRVMGTDDSAGRYKVKGRVFENTPKRYFNECNGFSAFLIKKNTQYQPVFYTGITYDSETDVFTFEDLPVSIDGYYMVLVGFECLDSVNYIRGDETYFSLPKHNMPIPKTNILIMVQNTNGYSYTVNQGDITLTEYYHNIYKIDNPKRRPFKAITLYSNKSANELIEYDTEIDFYLNTIKLLDRYKANTVPDVLREYKPITWDYLISDYADTIGIETPTSDPWFPFLYKLKKISSIYKLWCLFFQTFIRRTYGFLENWLLDVSTIDLESRLRTSTVPEIPITSEQYRPFSTPMYIFKYKNYSATDKDTTYGWFIDGRFAIPSYVAYVKGYNYVYFDASLIKEDSLIEVERFDGNDFHRSIQVADEYVGKVTWLERPVLMNSLYLTDSTGKFLTNGEYIVSVRDMKNLGDYWFDIDLNKSVFILENGMELKVTPKLAGYDHKTIFIGCNNRSINWNFDASQTSVFSDYNLNSGGYINRSKQNIVSRLRIYNSEGRLLPRYAYQQEPHNYVNVPPSFQVFCDPEVGNPFKIQYMGYDERIVFEMDKIPAKGMINLEGKLDKPFSLVYHTVFLNGYKLSERNIKQISPFVISIENVETVDNLVIYERLHDTDFFKFDTGESARSTYIADTLLREDPTYYAAVLDGISEIIIDPDIDDIDDEVNMFLAFIKRELGMKFINMDDIHSPEEYDVYEEIFNDWRILLNADDRVTHNIPFLKWFYMNHDYIIEAGGNN